MGNPEEAQRQERHLLGMFLFEFLYWARLGLRVLNGPFQFCHFVSIFFFPSNCFLVPIINTAFPIRFRISGIHKKGQSRSLWQKQHCGITKLAFPLSYICCDVTQIPKRSSLSLLQRPLLIIHMPHSYIMPAYKKPGFTSQNGWTSS